MSLNFLVCFDRMLSTSIRAYYLYGVIFKYCGFSDNFKTTEKFVLFPAVPICVIKIGIVIVLNY